jgi:hypothetical protein
VDDWADAGDSKPARTSSLAWGALIILVLLLIADWVEIHSVGANANETFQYVNPPAPQPQKK